MKTRIKILLITLLGTISGDMMAQTDTLLHKLDSLREKKVETGAQENKIEPEFYSEKTAITPSVFFILMGSNLKQEVVGPFHSSAKTWRKVGIAALIEAGLFFADKPLQRFAAHEMEKRPSVQQVSRFVTNFGGVYEVATLAAFGIYGFAFKNEKMRTTTLLASQSYITGALMESALKYLSGRERPNYINPATGTPEPTFKGPFANLGSTNSSFPSGHTTVAFAAATVYAMEYKDNIIFPIIAYSAASLIGLSRITENKHWATDVFAGAALGYVTGRQVVNNYHRYARLQRQKKDKGTLSFHLQYEHGVFMSRFVYTFR